MALAKDVLRGGMYNYEPANSAFVFTPKEARAEYARLRKIANRRLERLGASEFANSRTYQNWSSGFEALPPDAPERDIRKALYDVGRFVNLKTSSISGARKARQEFIETMHERGYTFINKGNAAKFGDFMAAVKTHQTYKGYDSERVAALFGLLTYKRIDPEDAAKFFEFWLEHERELAATPRSNYTVSTQDYIRMRYNEDLKAEFNNWKKTQEAAIPRAARKK